MKLLLYFCVTLCRKIYFSYNSTENYRKRGNTYVILVNIYCGNIDGNIKCNNGMDKDLYDLLRRIICV